MYNKLNKFPLIEFTISGNQIEDFYFEIQYSLNNDVNIEYLEDFKMNDCSKKNYIILNNNYNKIFLK